LDRQGHPGTPFLVGEAVGDRLKQCEEFETSWPAVRPIQ
jgi:hypothetical protein